MDDKMGQFIIVSGLVFFIGGLLVFLGMIIYGLTVLWFDGHRAGVIFVSSIVLMISGISLLSESHWR